MELSPQNLAMLESMLICVDCGKGGVRLQPSPEHNAPICDSCHDAALISAVPLLRNALEALLHACNHGNGCEAWTRIKDNAAYALRMAKP